MKTILIIPTYNERDNIGLLVAALQDRFRAIPHDMHVLVVDDGSPDGTAEVVRGIQRQHANVHLIEGRKAGLGSAYVRGMQYALDELGAEAVFEMDADFSHDPADVPRLMAELDRGADFVIGSRYVAGGSIPPEWGLLRKLISRYGNLVARYVAGIYRVRDCTAGFRAIRASVLRRIDFSKLKVQGYAFQVALLHAAALQQARIVEIPVNFVDRTRGQSKLGFSDIVEFVLNSWWIRFHSSATFIKFALVGISGVIVNLSTFALLMAAGLSKYLASPIATQVSILTNFALNNYWTFRWRTSGYPLEIKALTFNVASFLALAISYTSFVLLSLAFPNVTPYILQLIGIIPATAINYLLNSHWTFREKNHPGSIDFSGR